MKQENVLVAAKNSLAAKIRRLGFAHPDVLHSTGKINFPMKSVKKFDVFTKRVTCNLERAHLREDSA